MELHPTPPLHFFFGGGGGYVKNWNENQEIKSEIEIIGTMYTT